MRHLVIYWQNDSNDLHLLDEVPAMTTGNDGMEVLVSDFGATRVREIVEENPDCLILDTDGPATVQHVEDALRWDEWVHGDDYFPSEEAPIQDILRVLGIDDTHEVEHIIESELTSQDCQLWHSGAEPTPNVERLIDIFGAFQVWGMPSPQSGEEPLRVMWPA